MNASGTGTISYINAKENLVIAFGHKMFGAGEVYMPMVDAEVHDIMSSFASSFKLASPLNEIGMLIQDRQTGILGRVGKRMEMVPVEIVVNAPGRQPPTFNVEVVRDRRLTPSMINSAVFSAI